MTRSRAMPKARAFAVPVEPVPVSPPDGASIAIAAALTNQERRALMHREGGSEACMSWEVARSLYDRGLTLRNARFLRLTVLGARVRTLLQPIPIGNV